MPTKSFAIEISGYFEPPNTTKIFRYASSTESGLENMSAGEWSFEGRLTQVHECSKSVNGKDTLSVTTHTENLQNFPTGYTTDYVAEADGYYSVSSSESGAELRSLILPLGVKVGQSWKGSEFWDEDVLEAIVDYSAPGGSFEDCLQIARFNGDRTNLSSTVGEKQQEVAILCPGIGLVSSTITNSINAIRFRTVTTMELLSIE